MSSEVRRFDYTRNAENASMPGAWRMPDLIALLLSIILAFSGSAFAQTGLANISFPSADGLCRMKGCKAEDAGFAFQIPGLRKAFDIALSETSRDFRPANDLKNDSETKRNIGHQFLNHMAGARGDQHSILAETLAGPGHSSLQYRPSQSADKSFGSKFLRASLLTHTSQAANLFSMVVFSDNFKASCRSWADAKRNLHRAWTTPPVWDKDPWRVNYLGHPYAGSYYYNMLRTQGASPRAAFLYSTGQSLLWEFVIEAVSEQPSIQDLLVTSNIGSVLGEMSHRATTRMSRNGFSTLEKILTMIINPAYIFNNGFKKQRD
jgi:hypothetical protein